MKSNYFGFTNIDGLVKSIKRLFFVIPAQAGIQSFQVVRILWIPVFTGMTTFFDFPNIPSFHRFNRGLYQWK